MDKDTTPTVDQVAHDLVRGERAKTYGPPHINFQVITGLWNAYLQPRIQEMIDKAFDAGTNGDSEAPYSPNLVDENDVCNLMTLLKLAREVSGQGYHFDSTVDVIGYQIIKEILQTPIDEFLKEMK